MKAQDIAVFNRVSNSVGVQLMLKDICRSFIGGFFPLDLLIGRVSIEDGRTRKAK
jgi:hypothetical protein